ncbi:putative membrane protein YeiB [Serinibacter salmoneus]|uniref:Putative membrane protein YeiB n=1 Tax=Serinibacter salmoneus TaxID=556530 RepID=A0A2A9D2K5_9MICO|nr:putative membrane protein YeiB [Serinibacter salmoneus]
MVTDAPATTPSPPASRPTAPRLAGVDVARAVAILGMLIAHLGTGHHPQGGTGEDWMWWFDGRSSALFATLAGVSIALMSRRLDRRRPAGWGVLSGRLVVRAVVIMAIGVALMGLGTPVAIILPTYGVMFLMAIPVLRAPTWLLVLLGVLSATLAPVFVLWLRTVTTGSPDPYDHLFQYGVGEMVWGYYPALVWIAYLVVGMVVGRGLLAAGNSRSAVLVLGAAGVALAAIGYGAGVWLSAGLTEEELAAWPGVLANAEPHTDSPPEVVGNLGVTLAVLALCLLLCSVRPVEVALSPLAAAGSMSLTVYSAQIVVIAILGPDAVWYPVSNEPLILLALGSVLGAWIWRLFLGRGPLERLVTWLSSLPERAVEATRAADWQHR